MVKENLNTLQLQLKSNPIRNNYKHKPEEMITQYASNKPVSWPLLRQKRDLLSQSLECYMHYTVHVAF